MTGPSRNESEWLVERTDARDVAQSAPLRLERKLDTAAAPALFDALRDRAGADLVVDASDTDTMGALAAQTLAVAAAAWAAEGCALTVAGRSADLDAQIALLGFAALPPFGAGEPA